MTVVLVELRSNVKIRAEHLSRAAYVYVRQSSPFQVEHYRESGLMQRELAQRAEEAGWPKARTFVVDEDQGKSSSTPNSRSGFGDLVAAVGRGEVGIVIGLAVSRLARNSPDWANLMFMCRWTDTLIADEHGVYDPKLPTDRMVLGIRGQVSELELDTSIGRMVEARWHKARRGEMLTIPPAGYEIDDAERLVSTPDETVAHALRTVFSKFDELGTARHVFLWWRDQGLKFPVRRTEPRSHPVVWTSPRYRHILTTLKNPIYTGAYVFGRSVTVRKLDPQDPRKLKVSRAQQSEWPVLIKDHHPAYITFEQFVRNQERLRGNSVTRSEDGQGPAREGRALLQGLARCGTCGRRMIVSYGGGRPGQRSARVLQYRCMGARQNHEGKADCQLVGGKRLDDAVKSAFLEATAPAGEEAVRLAGAELLRQTGDVERALRLQVERAEYEAQRAERQYNAVEPENRTVARELERRWDASLREAEAQRAKLQSRQHELKPLTDAELERARQLGVDLEAVWSAATTTYGDQKRLLRGLIDEVQIRTEPERYLLQIIWKGGAATEREVVRLGIGKAIATSEDTVELVGKLAKEFDDAQISRILNKQGRKSGLGHPFSQTSVSSLRHKNKIPHCPRKLAGDPREGPFTADEAAEQLGVQSSTIHRWLREGVLAGKQVTRSAPWRIVLTDDVRRRLASGEAPAGWVGLAEAARRLGLSKPRVVYLVNTGKLAAVRTTIGKRQCWRINVASADCGTQEQLFDQKISDSTKET